MRLPHGCEGLHVRWMTVWGARHRPCMGRPVARPGLRNARLDVTTLVPATAYHRRSDAERYRRDKSPESQKSARASPGAATQGIGARRTTGSGGSRVVT